MLINGIGKIHISKNTGRKNGRTEIVMSEKKANFIKFISFMGGFLGAAICVCLGLKTMETDMAVSVLLFLLAAVFLILIYPLFQIGKLGNELNEQSKKIRALAKKQTKQKKSAPSAGNQPSVNKYPEKTEEEKTVSSAPIAPAVSAESAPAEAENTVLFPAVSDQNEKTEKTENNDVTQTQLTKEFTTMKQLNTHTGELITVSGAVTADSLEIYRPFRSATYIVPKMVTLAAGGLHTVAIRYDGSVVATGHMFFSNSPYNV